MLLEHSGLVLSNARFPTRSTTSVLRYTWDRLIKSCHFLKISKLFQKSFPRSNTTENIFCFFRAEAWRTTATSEKHNYFFWFSEISSIKNVFSLCADYFFTFPMIIICIFNICSIENIAQQTLLFHCLQVTIETTRVNKSVCNILSQNMYDILLCCSFHRPPSSFFICIPLKMLGRVLFLMSCGPITYLVGNSSLNIRSRLYLEFIKVM